MSKETIIHLLRSAPVEFLSGEDLARQCSISRTMVWKHIKTLLREGYGIEAVPSRGYRLTSIPDILRHSDIVQGLGTTIVGIDIRLFSEVASTNTLAMEMAAQGAPDGAVVIAETQTGGKGRLGRTWISPAGNLYMSVILRPEVPASTAPLITLMGAVAVTHAIRRLCGLKAEIKWPNDILISGRKVCGLLTEMSAEQDRIRHIVLGIGVDVNMDLGALPGEVQACATTLAAASGTRIKRTELLRTILRELDQWYQVFTGGTADILKEWERLNMTVGNRVTVRGSVETLEGQATGIDDLGRLLILTDNGILHAVSAGDVSVQKK